MATAPATHADDALLESILSLLTAYLHSGVTLPEECHRTLFAVTVHPLSTLLNRAPDLEGKAPVFDISSSVLYVRAEHRRGVSGGFPVTHASVMLRPRQRPSLRCAILAFVTAFMKRDEGVAGAFVSLSACATSSPFVRSPAHLGAIACSLSLCADVCVIAGALLEHDPEFLWLLVNQYVVAENLDAWTRWLALDCMYHLTLARDWHRSVVGLTQVRPTHRSRCWVRGETERGKKIVSHAHGLVALLRSICADDRDADRTSGRSGHQSALVRGLRYVAGRRACCGCCK